MLPRPWAGTSILGGRKGSCPFYPLPWGQEEQELPFTLNSPSFQSCEGAFSGVLDGLVQKNLYGGKPPDPQHQLGITMKPIC